MYSAKQLDQISDQTGTMSMPEVLYGFNRLYITNAEKDLLLEFAPIEGVSLASFAKQKALIKEKAIEQQFEGLSLNLNEEELKLNQIDLIPKQLEVKDAAHWKKKDMSKVKDFKMIEVISDWTYSSPYKGSVRYLSNHIERIKNETSLLLSSKAKGELRVENTEEGIPLDKLGRDNPIIHFGEVYLFEDDLGDQGYTMMSLRFRVMKDCFYVLVRYYLRVDEVLVRIFDTRIFHQFDKDYIIRDFQQKENNYDELRQKEFKLNSDWSLSKTQSDEVSPHLDLKLKTLEKIFF